jgi:malate dehydrogenase (quinone)
MHQGLFLKNKINTLYQNLITTLQNLESRIQHLSIALISNYYLAGYPISLTMSKVTKALVPKTDVVLIGAGIMSATLGIILKELNPDITIQIFEKLDQPGLESSDAWNNAGTGHSAFCELNYTPQKGDTIDISKAIKICQDYEVSREFWAYLVEKGYIKNPGSFIQSVPHMSFVWGNENVE